MPLLSGRAALACLLAPLALFAAPSGATLYEDGSGGADWVVRDATPDGASVRSVADDVLDGPVVETAGADRANAYLLGGTGAADGWNNTDERYLSFRLRTDESFSVYARVETTDGLRWLHYNQSNRDSLGTRNTVHHGLGSRVRDGRWRQFGRDLAADLAAGQPDNALLAVHGVLVRGDVRIDEVALGTELVPERVLPPLSPLVDLDAEDGDATVWRVFDDRPAGATVSVVADEGRAGRVYAFAGDGRSNGFVAGGIDATEGWNNTDQRVLSWAMRSTESYRLSVRVDTADGGRYLNYSQNGRDTLGHSNGRDIGFGLGRESKDGTWRRYTRDLAADLALAEPDNAIVAVQGVYVRGSLALDDLRLAGGLPPVAAIAGEAVRTVDTATEVVLDGSASEAPAGAIASWAWRAAGDDAVLGTEPVFAAGSLPAGEARYTLTVSDAAGRTDSASVTVQVVDTSAASLYEDAEDGTIDGWNLFDPTPEGATIANVADPSGAAGADGARVPGRVIELAGTDRQNGFLLGYWDARSPGWDNRRQTHLRWRMKADAPVLVYVRLETADGRRDLVYDEQATSRGPNGANTVLHHGLGPAAIDGAWHVWTRNVAADLAAFQPDNALIAVHGVFVRGSGRLDDIEMLTLDDEPGTPTDTAPPVVALAARPANGEAPLAVVLEPAGTVDDTGIVRATWDFGDGSEPLVLEAAAGETSLALDDVAHVYASGSWTATLGVADAAGNVASGSVGIVATEPAAVDTTPPVAAFEATVGGGDDSLAVTVDASASSDDTGVVAYAWDFGDGTEAGSGVAANHVYATAGTRTITLTATDAAGLAGTATREITLEEAGDPEGGDPLAVATASVAEGVAPLAVTFDGSGSSARAADGTPTGGELAHAWTFDDMPGAAPLEGVVVSRTFETVGTVIATLVVTDGAARTATATVDVTVTADGGGDGPITEADRDAARLLAQATFGPTRADIARVRELGIEGWIDDQLGREGAPHLDYVRANSNGSSREARHDVWWRDAITGDDQLRQRVAFALSQIFVVSDTGYTLGNAQYGITGYYDALRSGAFGSYRALLEDVTLHPVMGIYLSMLQNDKGDPEGNTRADENFAREVLQLFSIGPHALNADGSTRMAGASPVPAFTQDHVEAYARAFTGWNFAGASRWDFPVLRTDADKVRPMTPDEAHHDTGSKALLGGVTTPAGAGARADLASALDSIANHPNVGPFIASQLIRRLVTSNPTPAYVRRVAGVFDDDGTGERGDLGAVVRAILLDVEARSGHETVADFGKLREPVLRISHLWRAFGAQPGAQSVNGNFNTKSPHAKDLDTLTGQAVLKSPSVFNFYRPDHAPLGEIRDAGRVAPEAEIYTDGHILATTTRVNSHVQLHHDLADANSLKSTWIDLSGERALLAAGGPAALLERLDLLLLSGGMEDGLRGVLREHVASFPDTEDGRSEAVRDAITLIMASPAYLVQL